MNHRQARHRDRTPTKLAVTIPAVIGAAALGIGVSSCGESETTTERTTERDVQLVSLEAANTPGTSPWMESIASPGLPTRVTRVEVAGASRTVSGDQVGLYGGSANFAVCERDKMVDYLERNPVAKAAWQSVTGASDIRAFAEKLSPLQLTRDVQVTNHGLEDGHATAFQSVLQTGTAVLVDDRGLPRVRCDSGSPLAEPEGDVGDTQFSGTGWPSLDAESVVTIERSEAPVERLEVVDMGDADVPYPAPTTSSAQQFPGFLDVTIGDNQGVPALDVELPPGSTAVSVQVEDVNSVTSTITTTDTTTTETTETTRRRRRRRPQRLKHRRLRQRYCLRQTLR